MSITENPSPTEPEAPSEVLDPRAYNPKPVVKALLYNRILLALGFLGLFVAGFLSIAKALSASIPCGAAGGCDKLSDGPAGSWLGTPVAYLGVVGYVLLTALAVVRVFVGQEKTRNLVMPGYAVAAVGTAASLYLQYQALIVYRETCYWCLASALDMVATLIVYALLAQAVDDAPEGALPRDGAAVPMGAALAAAVVLGLGGSTMMLVNGGKAKPVDINTKVPLIPSDAHTMGNPNAKLTIVEFADMYCPACRRTSPKVKEFVEQHADTMRFVYRHFPLLDKHPLALNAALISEIAAEKGQFWNYLVGVMSREGEEEETLDELYTVGKTLGVDPDLAKKRIQNDQDPIYAKVQRDMAAADQLGLTMTPTFILLVDGKPSDTASSNDILQKLQKPPYKAMIEGKQP